MNKFNPNIHHRKSIRLKDYDYSQEGLYFITICTQNRECLFGEIMVGAGSARPNETNAHPEMQLNETGQIIETEWLNLKNKYHNIDLHEFIVMPNHFHGILQIITPFVATVVGDNMTDIDGIEAGKPRPYVPTLGNVVAYFKYQTTKQIGRDTKLWQRNYHEHIIRNQKSYETISKYIINNPTKWKNDRFSRKNRNNTGTDK